MRKLIVLIALLALFTVTVSTAQDDAEPEAADPGLITIESSQPVEETVAAIEAALEEAGFIIPLIVDHSANAANVDLELLPTTLIIFGNPNVGTQLMQASRSVAIDLPQKMLVWEDEDGQVYITYNDPQYLAERHGIEGMDELLGNVANALGNFANAGTAADE
ncbi:MAG: DUF302 domain-containing protein [Chloroflexi bacterium]|nr:DUF302 domain-containing protein [Chloroflexota bacterium]